jgi:hypothetical protein
VGIGGCQWPTPNPHYRWISLPFTVGTATLVCGFPGLTGWRAPRQWPGYLDDHELLQAMEPQRKLHEPELSRLDPVRPDLCLVKADLARLPPGEHVEEAAHHPAVRRTQAAGQGTTRTAARRGRHSPTRRASHHRAGDPRRPARHTTGSRSPKLGLAGPRRCQARQVVAVPPLRWLSLADAASDSATARTTRRGGAGQM